MAPPSYLVLALALLVVPVAVLDAAEKKPDPLSMTMSASMAPAQADVVVRMRVEPDARSRELTLEWIADDLSGGSTSIALDGARAAMTHRYAIKRMSPGAYTVVATLHLSDGTHVRRTSTLTVVGMAGRY